MRNKKMSIFLLRVNRKSFLNFSYAMIWTIFATELSRKVTAVSLICFYDAFRINFIFCVAVIEWIWLERICFGVFFLVGNG